MLTTSTHAFSRGFCAQKSVGSFKYMSKLSSTLQHLLSTSDWAMGSGDILVGSCMPSYLKAGCFRSWRGWTRRLIKEKTTRSLVTPLFLTVAITRRMLSTCLPPGPLLDQLSWTWGRQQFFLEVGIQSSQHGTRTSFIPLLYLLDHKLSTHFESQDGVPIHILRRRQD